MGSLSPLWLSRLIERVQTFNLISDAPGWWTETISNHKTTTITTEMEQPSVVLYNKQTNAQSAKLLLLRLQRWKETQAPKSTINRLVRPRSIVGSKKETVVAVTQTNFIRFTTVTTLLKLFATSRPNFSPESQTPDSRDLSPEIGPMVRIISLPFDLRGLPKYIYFLKHVILSFQVA